MLVMRCVCYNDYQAAKVTWFWHFRREFCRQSELYCVSWPCQQWTGTSRANVFLCKYVFFFPPPNNPPSSSFRRMSSVARALVKTKLVLNFCSVSIYLAFVYLLSRTRYKFSVHSHGPHTIWRLWFCFCFGFRSMFI